MSRQGRFQKFHEVFVQRVESKEEYLGSLDTRRVDGIVFGFAENACEDSAIGLANGMWFLILHLREVVAMQVEKENVNH